jgi:two-component system response regulator FixJ
VLQDRPSVELAVAAMRAGATDILTKPLDTARLLLLVREALRQLPPAALPPRGDTSGPGGHVELTRREREVLQLIASGHSNREAGDHLGISPRTIEVHRARVMEKFGARNAADLMRIVLTG